MVLRSSMQYAWNNSKAEGPGEAEYCCTDVAFNLKYYCWHRGRGKIYRDFASAAEENS